MESASTSGSGNRRSGQHIGLDSDGSPAGDVNGDSRCQRPGTVISALTRRWIRCAGVGVRLNFDLGNVIVGNEVRGILIEGATSTGEKIAGNLIGTNSHRLNGLGNGGDGIQGRIANNHSGQGTRIGSTTPPASRLERPGTGSWRTDRSQRWRGHRSRNEAEQRSRSHACERPRRTVAHRRHASHGTPGETYFVDVFTSRLMTELRRRRAVRQFVTVFQWRRSSGRALPTGRCPRRLGDRTATATDPNGNSSEFSAASGGLRRRWRRRLDHGRTGGCQRELRPHKRGHCGLGGLGLLERQWHPVHDCRAR